MAPAHLSDVELTMRSHQRMRALLQIGYAPWVWLVFHAAFFRAHVRVPVPRHGVEPHEQARGIS